MATLEKFSSNFGAHVDLSEPIKASEEKKGMEKIMEEIMLIHVKAKITESSTGDSIATSDLFFLVTDLYERCQALFTCYEYLIWKLKKNSFEEGETNSDFSLEPSDTDISGSDIDSSGSDADSSGSDTATSDSDISDTSVSDSDVLDTDISHSEDDYEDTKKMRRRVQKLIDAMYRHKAKENRVIDNEEVGEWEKKVKEKEEEMVKLEKRLKVKDGEGHYTREMMELLEEAIIEGDEDLVRIQEEVGEMEKKVKSKEEEILELEKRLRVKDGEGIFEWAELKELEKTKKEKEVELLELEKEAIEKEINFLVMNIDKKEKFKVGCLWNDHRAWNWNYYSPQNKTLIRQLCLLFEYQPFNI